jgi:hypothetical protein
MKFYVLRLKDTIDYVDHFLDGLEPIYNDLNHAVLRSSYETASSLVEHSPANLEVVTIEQERTIV